MSDETSRPTCPFKLAGPYVPPRFQQGPMTTALNLGPLAFLAGSWRGPGFNAIWRPDNPPSRPLTTPPNPTKRLLELNLTNDSFDFLPATAVLAACDSGFQQRPLHSNRDQLAPNPSPLA